MVKVSDIVALHAAILRPGQFQEVLNQLQIVAMIHAMDSTATAGLCELQVSLPPKGCARRPIHGRVAIEESSGINTSRGRSDPHRAVASRVAPRLQRAIYRSPAGGKLIVSAIPTRARIVTSGRIQPPGISPAED
jgi:hypothetical protein